MFLNQDSRLLHRLISSLVHSLKLSRWLHAVADLRIIRLAYDPFFLQALLLPMLSPLFLSFLSKKYLNYTKAVILHFQVQMYEAIDYMIGKQNQFYYSV